MKVKTKNKIFTFLLTILIVAQPGIIQAYGKEAKTEPYLDYTGPRVIVSKDKTEDKATRYVDGELLVRFTDSYSKDSAKMDSVNQKFGAATIKTFSSVDGLQLVKLPKDMSVNEAIKKYESNSAIKYAQPNYLYFVDETTPDDSDLYKLWGLNNYGQEVNGQTGTVDADIDAVEAWDTTTGSSDVIIAVIDTGVMYNHPDLQNNIWTNTLEIADDGIDNDGNGYIDDIRGWDFFSDDNDPMDEMGHGTHVSGTIAGEGNNGEGVAGVLWNAKIMPLRFIGPEGGSSEDAIEAIEYADANGAQIMNNSWGSYDNDLALKDAISASPELVVCAAGNDGENNDYYMHYPSSFDCDNIISVAATDNQDNIADFSNYGVTTVDVAAPGVDIYSTLPAGDYRHSSLIFSDSMDTLDNWQTYPYDSWQVTTDRYVSEPASIANIDYLSNQTNWLYSNTPLDLSDAIFAKLEFDLWLDAEENYDFLYVLFSFDDYTYYIADKYTGQTGNFQTLDVDLTDAAGSSTVYLAFVLQSDSSITAEGAYVDDVKIYTTNDFMPSYGYYSGTSMATPHVAGLAGLIKSANPTLTSQEIKDIIINNVDQIDSLDGVVLSGGRINANNSVLAADSVVGVPVTGVSLDQSTMSLVEGGTSGCLIATVMPENATNKNVTWSSSDETIATVAGGIVTPVTPGITTVTVETEDGNFTDACEVTVTTAAVPVTGVSLDQSTMSLVEGGTAGTLTAMVMPENATNKNVTWSSSDETIATVAGGIVTPVTPGITTVTVETEDGNFTDTCEVTVSTAAVAVTGVSLDQSTMSLVEGGTAGTLTATVMPENATNKNVTWSSSDETVAIVANGIVTPISAGTVIVTVETEDGNFTGACTVTVEIPNVPVTGVGLNKSILELIEGGETETLIATVRPENATNKNITWSSTNNYVASVINGVVIPRNPGSAIIIVETEDGHYTAYCTVNVAPKRVDVTGVSLDQSTMSLMEGGATGTLTATVQPENATNKNVTWSSSDETIATVADGVVMPITAGTAIITVETEDGNYTDTCIVTVVTAEVAVTGVSLDQSTMDLVEGGMAGKLVATVTPEDATNKNVTWSSSDESVATIVNGVVTPIAPGTTTITVETVDGNFTAFCEVTVSPAPISVTGVSLDKSLINLTVNGATDTLVATITPEDATNKNVTWSSSDEAVATVADGVVTPIAKGEAIITVETEDGNYTASCDVIVAEAPISVTGVSLDKSLINLTVNGATGTLTATITPEDATNKNVIWSSSNEAVATVADGVVTPIAKGKSVITVETEDGNYNASCNVIVKSKSTHKSTSTISLQSTPVPYTIIDKNGDIIAAIDIEGNGGPIVAVTNAIVDKLMKYAVDENAAGLLLNLKLGEKELKITDVQFPASLFINAEQDNINGLIIKMGATSMMFDDNNIQDLSDNATTMELAVNYLDENEMSEKLLQQVGSHPVFDFSFYVDSAKATQFNKPVKISLECSLQEGETADNAVAYLINDSDELELIHNCIYNEETGEITFYTNSSAKFVAMKSLATKQFKDLANFMWAERAINILVSRNVIDGMDEAHYAPSLNITKGQFIKLLIDTLNLNDENASSEFSDVGKEHWAYTEISSGIKLGIVSGIDEDLFGVNNEITREEMAAMSYNAIKASSVELNIDDTRAQLIDLESLSNNSKEAIKTLYQAGIINGIGKDMFDPKGKLNRAAAAQIIYKIYMLQQ